MRRLFLFVGLLVWVCGCANGSGAFTVGDDGGGGGDSGPPNTVDDATTGTPDSASTGNDGGSGADSAPLQTCVHNSDCTAGVANLCQGNNGVACLGGFCVPTGKPENCDDGIACVNASCDANTNQCVYTPNDSACPVGSYCDPTLNCVANLPCTPGDSVCDRLDTNACLGLWSCVATGGMDAGASYCVQASPPCQNIPNAATLCNGISDGGAAPVGDGGAVTCSWQCDPGYDHPVWTGTTWQQAFTIDSPPDVAGCDCKFAETSDGGIAYDPPDLGFTDSNCDGIDGTIAVAVFVDVNALTGGDGSMRYPFVTIGEGITAAQASAGAKTDVYVSKGTYPENVTMVNGVGIYGGYDSSNKWSRSLTTNTTLIASQTNVGVDVQNLTKPFNIQLFSVSSQAATGTANNGGGQSSYGIRVVNCSAGGTISGCTITPGAGAPAPSGAPTGSPGVGGSQGGNASNGTPGAGGGSACGASGGAGGAGVGNINGGVQGTQGTTVSGGGAGGPGGPGGSAGYCNATSAGNGDNAPSFTPGGAQGNSGPNASTGTALGTFDSSGNYQPAQGIGGGTGAPGGGAGGGGSGGGTQYGCGFLDLSCCEADSGGGGGGGGGGCGGNPGGGGYGGGSSFALVLIGSSLTLTSNNLSTAPGGNGGPGGGGGAGGVGGGGGAGGSNYNGGDHSAGSGANGQSGGSGGEGGGGSGGPGGSSACFAFTGTSPSSSGDTCSNGGAGTGGQGGSNGLSNAGTGPNGETGTTLNIP